MKSLRVESINIGSPTVWMRITDGPNKRLNRKFRYVLCGYKVDFISCRPRRVGVSLGTRLGAGQKNLKLGPIILVYFPGPTTVHTY